MTQLSDIVNRRAQKNLLQAVGYDSRRLAVETWPLLDEFHQAQCGIVDLTRRFKNAAHSFGRSKFRDMNPEQAEIPFSIEGAVTISGADETVRLTISLTRSEYQQVIEAHAKRLEDYENSFGNLLMGDKNLSPYWDQNPDWTFGDCLSAYLLDKANEQNPNPTRKETT